MGLAISIARHQAIEPNSNGPGLQPKSDGLHLVAMASTFPLFRKTLAPRLVAGVNQKPECYGLDGD